MKIKAITKNPQSLVHAINKAIQDNDLKTWKKLSVKDHNVIYSHTPVQWDEKAMLEPTIHEDCVTFDFIWWMKNGEPEEPVKGYILGRFVEILMVHFRRNFDHLIID